MSKHDRAVDNPGKAEPAAKSLGSPSGSGPASSADGPDTEPVRRALIRATLKPGEGAPPMPRQAPVFTMHEQPRGGSGATRGSWRSPNSHSQRDNGHPNKKKVKTRSGRHGQQTDRNGQPRSGRPTHPASSRRGKSRPR